VERPATIRVVVADDSAFMRGILRAALEKAGIEVVAVARDGDEALDCCRRLRPEVLCLDLAMPGRDGIGVLRALRDDAAAPAVVVVSAFSPADGTRAVDVLAEGAFELVSKPSGPEGLSDFAAELERKVRLAGEAGPRTLEAVPAPVAAGQPVAPRASGDGRAVVIACSTGGPRALARLLPELPSPLGAGTLVVQHMPPGFTGSLAQRLDRTCALDVREAADGDEVSPGRALIAPGGRHLHITADGVARLGDEPPVGGLRPRADLTIADAAACFGERTLLVVLTGMGADGLEGAKAVRRAGGRVLVEHASTATIHGMPRAVAEAGLADAELPLHELPAAIAAEAGAPAAPAAAAAGVAR
jgi:two-component system chemotaxis response regulator CheB